MEDYAAKMQLKPDAALREYVTGYAQYRDEAVLAALAELERRGRPAPEAAALRPLLEAAVRQQQAAAEASRRSAAADAEDDENLPELYSPIGILVISATVSVVAGAVLLGLNLQRLRRTGAVVGLAAFVLAYLLGEMYLIQYLAERRQLSTLVLLLIDLPLILAYMWWFWPRYVRTYKFRSRNWLLPLGICVLLKLGLALLVLKSPQLQQLIKQQMEQLQPRQGIGA